MNKKSHKKAVAKSRAACNVQFIIIAWQDLDGDHDSCKQGCPSSSDVFVEHSLAGP